MGAVSKASDIIYDLEAALLWVSVQNDVCHKDKFFNRVEQRE